MIKKHPVLTVAFAGLLLLIAAVLVWRISLNAANNRRLRAISASGEPVTLEELDQFYKAVPEGSNAALLWLEGIAALTSESAEIARAIPMKRGVRLTEEQLRNARNALEDNAKALALFHRAATLTASRYPISLNEMVSPEFTHLGEVKGAAQILRTEAAVAAEDSNGKAAAEAINCIFAAGRSLSSEPVLLSQLTKYAVDAIGVFAIQSTLNRLPFSETNLIALQQALSIADDAGSASLALIGERALFIGHLQNPEEWVAANAQAANVAVEESVPQSVLNPLVRLTLKRDMRFGIDALSTNIGFSRLPDPQRFNARTNAEAMAQRATRGYYILTALLLPAVDKVFTRDALHKAQLRSALAAVAVERFRLANGGKLPDELTVLVPAYIRSLPIDPYDGKPPRYKRTEKGYVVYCIGVDEKDDGGTEKVPNAPKGAPEDVTFIVERVESR
jgi:hypothetical protein